MISLDWTLGLQFLNFVVLLFLLNKILYRPLLNIMTERREKIEGGKAHARELEGEIEAKIQSYQEQLNAAKAGASGERLALRQEAQKQEAAITGEAQQKAAERISAIRGQVEKEAVAAREALRQEATSLAGQIAEKVLGRTLA